jgi:hypothetical protein
MDKEILDSMISDLQRALDKASQLREALFPIASETETKEYEPSGLDEFAPETAHNPDESLRPDLDEDMLIKLEEFNSLSMPQLKKMAIAQDFDENEVNACTDKHTLRKAVWEDKYHIDYPKTFTQKLIESGEQNIPDESNLGFASLAQLRNFAIQVRGLKLEDIRHYDQGELFEFLTKKDDKSEENTPLYTESKLKSTPLTRLRNIAGAMDIDPVGLLKDDLIKAILAKQEKK